MNAFSTEIGICFRLKPDEGIYSTEKGVEKVTIEESKDLTKYQAIPIVIMLIVWDTTLLAQMYIIGLMLIFSYEFLSDVLRWGKDKRKFHAAEHMCINAYEKLGRVPTIEEIKEQSRFHYGCGTNDTVKKLLFCIVTIGVFVIENSPMNFPMKGLVVIQVILLYVLFIEQSNINLLASKLKVVNFLQLLTTAQPSERHLEIARSGLQDWENASKKNSEQ